VKKLTPARYILYIVFYVEGVRFSRPAFLAPSFFLDFRVDNKSNYYEIDQRMFIKEA
jgi:hypothetical protein